MLPSRRPLRVRTISVSSWARLLWWWGTSVHTHLSLRPFLASSAGAAECGLGSLGTNFVPWVVARAKPSVRDRRSRPCGVVYYGRDESFGSRGPVCLRTESRKTKPSPLSRRPRSAQAFSRGLNCPLKTARMLYCLDSSLRAMPRAMRPSWRARRQRRFELIEAHWDVPLEEHALPK